MKTNKSGYTKNSAGTLVVNPNLDAYSYDWYKLGMQVGDVYLVNNFNYSSTTIKHYYKLMRFIREQKGLKIVTIEAPKGLQNLKAAQDHYAQLMQNVSAELVAPRKRETTKKRLAAELVELEKQYNFVMELMQNENQY